MRPADLTADSLLALAESEGKLAVYLETREDGRVTGLLVAACGEHADLMLGHISRQGIGPVIEWANRSGPGG